MDALNLVPDTFEANCSGAKLPTVELKILHLLMSVSGIVCSVIIILFLFVLIVASRAYKTSLQRLNIYNIILGLICEVAYALQIEVHFKTKESVQETFCEALGFCMFTHDSCGTLSLSYTQTVCCSLHFD